MRKPSLSVCLSQNLGWDTAGWNGQTVTELQQC